VTASDEVLTSAARLKHALEPLHAMVYFVPEGNEIYSAIGLRPGRMPYFASRSAAFGAVGAGAVTATFYNFNPTLVAKFIPDAWTKATPAAVLSARYEVVDAALTRLLGAEAIASPELAEATELITAGVQDLDPDGRALYAAHADLPWPDAIHLRLWHAITLFREWRGDAHVAALVGHGLGGLDALVTHTATGRGFTVATAKITRGWSDEQWAASVASLQKRELLDATGELSAAGGALRAKIEYQTDRTSLTPVLTLGAAKTARLVELGRGLSRQIVANGAFPAGTFA
jgi:hypothetical protein